MKSILRVALALFFSGQCFGQDEAGVKNYPAGTKAGEITLLNSRIASNGRLSSKTFTIMADKTAAYELKAVAGLLPGATMEISLDNQPTGTSFKAVDNGWQELSAGSNGKMQQLMIPAGKHELRFTQAGDMVPMVDDIFFQSQPGFSSFDAKWQEAKRNIDKASAKSTNLAPRAKGMENESSLVLSNPEGIYDQEVDVNFAYTSFMWIGLTAGTTVTFATNSSTVDPVLHLFLPSNIDNYSWSNDDFNGIESSITVTIPVSGTYALVVRPYWNAQSGTCNVTKDGAAYLSNTPLGGLRFYNTSRTGDLNFFTCRLTAGDTRMFVNNYGGAPYKGYNDDYSGGGGNWVWGVASRIKKNFPSAVSNSFVCAYSLLTTGACDVYMGNPNSEVNKNNNFEFPSLQPDDAIKTGMYSDNYNCTSWAGGVTSSFIWPPEWSSTYSCSGNSTMLDCFDHFYANTPSARYPGAWNYTRTGATSANNTIDLWKNGSTYTHASVRKPGNNHPHGYDWESKPGHLARTLHPRNALNGPGYGAVTDYYKFAGTYASFGNGPQQAFATDADAINAGVAVIENAKLSAKANDKLNRLTGAIGKVAANQFNVLYEAWKKTWEANAIYSDPEMYRRNAEFDALSKFCQSNYNNVYLVFDKYVNGDNFIGKILWDMTRSRYSKLLDEAKTDILNNPYDEQGRYKIHGDIDNGIRYVEKILNSIDEIPVDAAVGADVAVSISPNPVRDIVTVLVNSGEKHRISVQLIAVNSNKTMVLQSEKEFAAGQYRFSGSIASMGLSNGELIAIKLIVDGKEKTLKAIVVR